MGRSRLAQGCTSVRGWIEATAVPASPAGQLVPQTPRLIEILQNRDSSKLFGHPPIPIKILIIFFKISVPIFSEFRDILTSVQQNRLEKRRK